MVHVEDIHWVDIHGLRLAGIHGIKLIYISGHMKLAVKNTSAITSNRDTKTVKPLVIGLLTQQGLTTMVKIEISTNCYLAAVSYLVVTLAVNLVVNLAGINHMSPSC